MKDIVMKKGALFGPKPDFKLLSGYKKFVYVYFWKFLNEKLLFFNDVQNDNISECGYYV